MTTLECRHTFHVNCVVNWFRYNHQGCPNCRSCDTSELWSRKTPHQRVSILRRRKRRTPEMNRLIGRLDGVRAKRRALTEEHKEYRRTNAGVIRTLVNHHRTLQNLAEREECLVERIDRSCHTVPRMRMMGVVEEDEDSD